MIQGNAQNVFRIDGGNPPVLASPNLWVVRWDNEVNGGGQAIRQLKRIALQIRFSILDAHQLSIHLFMEREPLPQVLIARCCKQYGFTFRHGQVYAL